MTLEQFKAAYDKPLAVILLGGKRNVANNDKNDLLALGKLLTLTMKHATFRSGNTGGADALFCEYVKARHPNRLELILPYSKHRAKQTGMATTYAVDEIDLRNEHRVLELISRNKEHTHLVDIHLGTALRSIVAKAAYMLRDAIKVTGTMSGILPATAGLFYEDLSNPKAGDTGYTMQMCDAANVPWFDQSVWMPWLDISNHEVVELLNLISEAEIRYGNHNLTFNPVPVHCFA